MLENVLKEALRCCCKHNGLASLCVNSNILVTLLQYKYCIVSYFQRVFIFRYFRDLQKLIPGHNFLQKYITAITNRMLACTHVVQWSLRHECISSGISSLCLNACQIQKACYLKHCPQLLLRLLMKLYWLHRNNPRSIGATMSNSDLRNCL